MVRETSAGKGLVVGFWRWVGSETAEREHLGGVRSGLGLKKWVLEMGFGGGSGMRGRWEVRDWVWRSIGLVCEENVVGGQ